MRLLSKIYNTILVGVLVLVLSLIGYHYYSENKVDFLWWIAETSIVFNILFLIYYVISLYIIEHTWDDIRDLLDSIDSWPLGIKVRNIKDRLNRLLPPDRRNGA